MILISFKEFPMPLDIVVGAQWGDEGKGRVVDLLAEKAHLVARYNGGDNAGHTVTVGPKTYKLHLLPSGMVHPHTFNVMGGGMVITPATLIGELDSLQQDGLAVGPERLLISYAAHLITPAHKALDSAQEQARGRGQIGTTGRGIGPAYTDRAARTGLRMADLLDLPAFSLKLHAHIEDANRRLAEYGFPALNADAVVKEYQSYADRLVPYIGDVSGVVWQALLEGKTVLAEGAQGTLLDIDLGTYPFVTSSNPTAPGAYTGLGIGLGHTGRVLGVTKSFQTRVGAGPFPSEVFGEAEVRLRGTGANPWDEFGTTTGRPRRVGWLDGVLLRYACRSNGFTELAVTKLDVLSGLKTLPLCTAYQSGGKTLTDLPLGPADLSPFQPVYQELPGWQEDLTGVRRWNELPRPARGYIEAIELLTGLPVTLVSVGPEREQVVKK
jgi:adenylosuccinate synthase